MSLQPAPSLGVLNLERGPAPSPPRAGSILHPYTFNFPIISGTVEGAWADRVIRGDPALEPAFITAARRLVARGAVVITSNCGFSIRHQAAVAASVNVPVITSSLLLVPTLLRQLPRSSKLAVLTADSSHCSEDLLGVDETGELARVVIGGIEGGKLLENEMKRPPIFTETADIEADVRARVSQLCAAHPDIGAILFECTAFPAVAPAIRGMTGLPVYDIATLCKMTFASVA